MADLGHQLTDEELKKLEREIAREYRTAVKDMQKKLEAYLEKTEEQRQVQEALYKAGKITKEEYQNWCFRHEMVGKRWEQMRDVLAGDMVNTNKIALKMTKDKMPDVYALNCNYATYQIEHDGKIDTGFTLYNHDTAEYLLGDQRQLMPKPSTRKAKEIAANKDMQWNMKKIQSAVLQGVLQGESPYDVAKRLERVGQMNYNASVRYARTMTTSAQNAGRYEAFRRAKKLGVDLTIEWQATLDGRTRHDHRMMHGKRTEVDKPFHTPDGFTIYYPADCTGSSDAPQSEIWNCRCTLLSWVKGFEGDTVKSSPKMEGKTFEEWQNEKAPKAKEPAKPYSNKQEYEEYKKQMEERWEQRRIELEEEQNREKETLLDEEYGGSFTLQRIEIRRDENLSEEEKERLIEAVDEKRKRYYKEVEGISEKYAKLWEKELADHTIYDLDYEFRKIKEKAPLYDTIKVINPDYWTGGFGYTNNCQRCSIATELRLRGYDVVAEACGPSGGMGAASQIHSAFRDATRFDTTGGREAVKDIIRQMEEWGDGSRGVISAGFPGGGHAFNVVNDKGIVRFVDSQSGMIWGTDEQGPETIYGSVVERATQTTLYRTDNARFYGVPDGWVRNK